MGTLSMAGMVFHEIPVKVYDGIHITYICPQVVCNLLWHTCISPGVIEKCRLDEKLKNDYLCSLWSDFQNCQAFSSIKLKSLPYNHTDHPPTHSQLFLVSNERYGKNKTFLLRCYGIDFAPIKRYNSFCFLMIVHKEAKIIPLWSLNSLPLISLSAFLL